jgi:hypothetical protein
VTRRSWSLSVDEQLAELDGWLVEGSLCVASIDDDRAARELRLTVSVLMDDEARIVKRVLWWRVIRVPMRIFALSFGPVDHVRSNFDSGETDVMIQKLRRTERGIDVVCLGATVHVEGRALVATATPIEDDAVSEFGWGPFRWRRSTR